eukprot:gene37073-50014_t
MFSELVFTKRTVMKISGVTNRSVRIERRARRDTAELDNEALQRAGEAPKGVTSDTWPTQVSWTPRSAPALPTTPTACRSWGRATLGTIPLAWLGAHYAGPKGALVGSALGAIVFGVLALVFAYRGIARLERKAATDRAAAQGQAMMNLFEMMQQAVSPLGQDAEHVARLQRDGPGGDTRVEPHGVPATGEGDRALEDAIVFGPVGR